MDPQFMVLLLYQGIGTALKFCPKILTLIKV